MLFGLRTSSLMGGAVISAFAAFAIAQGCSDGAPPGGTTKIVVTEAASGLNAPLDAAPDPKDETIFFLATGANGIGVFKVKESGGTPSEVFSGDPFVDPHGIVVDPDGSKIYVADRASEAGAGAIYTLPVGGGMPTLLAGTSGTHPSALDIAEVKGETDVYFTGTDMDGVPAVFSIPPDGGTATKLAGGEPLGKPDGIAAAMDGAVYVTDEAPTTGGQGAVFKVQGGKITSVANGFVAGNPAGTALTLDESSLLVSSIDESQGTSQVLIVDLATAKTTTFSDVIKQNNVSGGLHRSIASNSFAWSGFNTVYSVKIKKVQFEGSTPGGPSN